MAEVTLYPWFIENRFYFISGFDKGWFDETELGLVPTDITANIWCQANPTLGIVTANFLTQ